MDGKCSRVKHGPIATIDHIFGQWSGSESDDGAVSELIGIEAWSGVYGGTVSQNKAINIIMDNLFDLIFHTRMSHRESNEH